MFAQRLIEIWMIQNVEGLSANLQLCAPHLGMRKLFISVRSVSK